MNHPAVLRNVRRTTQRGVTFIEMLATLTVLALTVGAVAPSVGQMRDRRHLEGAAAQLATDVRYARSLALAHRAAVRLSVHSQGGNSCYVLHTGPAASCSCGGGDTATCSTGAQLLKVVGFDASGPVRFSSNSSSMLFDPDRGTVTPTGTMRLQLSNGPSLHQIVNIMGRVRACSPSGAMNGYPTC